MAFRARVIACLIATEIAPSDSGVDSSRDCSLVDCILFDFDSGRVVPGLIQQKDIWNCKSRKIFGTGKAESRKSGDKQKTI